MKRGGLSGGKNRATKRRLTARTLVERTNQNWAERAFEERISWLRRPRLHAAMFDEERRQELFDLELANRGIAPTTVQTWTQSGPASTRKLIDRRAEIREKIESALKPLGWSPERCDAFKQMVLAYRAKPSINNYLSIRRKFPEVEIQIARFEGDPLYALSEEFRKQGIDPDLVFSALYGDEPSVDALALRLLECLVARKQLPKNGPGHITKRREAISDGMVNYLIVVMLEAFDWHEELARIPASLIVLIRDQLCGEQPDLDAIFRAHEMRERIAGAVAVCEQLEGKYSIRKMATAIGVPKSTLARLMVDNDFKKLVASRRWINEQAKTWK